MLNPNIDEEDKEEPDQNTQGPSPSRPPSKRSNWKHKSSHPLENLTSLFEFGMQTRAQARNFMVFSAFLSQIKPKNVNKSLKILTRLILCRKNFSNLKGKKSGTWSPGLLTKLLLGQNGCTKTSKLNMEVSINKASLIVQGYYQDERID